MKISRLRKHLKTLPYFIPGQIFTGLNIATSRPLAVSIVRSSDIEPLSRCGSRHLWLRPKPKTPPQPQMPRRATHRRSHSIPTPKTPTRTGGARCAKPKRPLEPPQLSAWKQLDEPRSLPSPKLPPAAKSAKSQRPTRPPSDRQLDTQTRRFAAKLVKRFQSCPAKPRTPTIPMLKFQLRHTLSQTTAQRTKPQPFLHRNRPRAAIRSNRSRVSSSNKI